VRERLGELSDVALRIGADADDVERRGREAGQAALEVESGEIDWVRDGRPRLVSFVTVFDRTRSRLERGGCGTLARVKRLAALALVLLVSTGAAAALAAGSTPFGAKYKTVVKGQAPALNGTWQIAFTPTGTYTVTKQGTAGKLIVGKATASGNTLVFHDSSGPLACPGGKSGSYVWTLKGTKLTLKILKDPCGGRPLILAGAPFTKT